MGVSVQSVVLQRHYPELSCLSAMLINAPMLLGVLLSLVEVGS